MIEGTRLQHAAFHTTDLDKTRDFYGSVIGLKEIVRPNLMRQGILYNAGPEHEIHITLSDSTGVPSKGRVSISANEAWRVDTWLLPWTIWRRLRSFWRPKAWPM